MGNMNTMNNQKEMHDFPNKKINNPNANPNPNPNPNPNILSDANSTKNEINPNDSTSVLNPKSSRPVNPVISGRLLAILSKPSKIKRMIPWKSFRGIKALTGPEQDLNSKKSIVLKSTSQQINLTSHVRFYYYVLINTFDCILTS